MNRIMRDSTTAADIPTDTDMVAGYVDGAYRWSPADWARFPASTLVRIATQPNTAPAEAGDCETGDMAPEQTPDWVRLQWAYGITCPAVYCNRGNEDAVDAALHAAGIPTDRAGLWVATLDGSVVTGVSPSGYPIVACQDKGSAQTGAHYDESVVFDTNWTAGGDVDMILLVKSDGSQFLLTGSACVWVPSMDDVSALLAAGVRQARVEDKLVDELTAKSGGPAVGGTLSVSGSLTVS